MKKILISTILNLFLICGFAQDFHLSQYWASPLNLNPALTGVFDDNIRFAANYRNQWFNYTTFATYAVSVDANLWRNKMNGNILGVGLGFYQDIEGKQEFTNTGVNLNLAYNQKIGGRGINHYIGIGMQGAYYAKQINLKNLIYGNLFENNNNTDPLDFLEYQQRSVIDVSAGLNYFVNINNRHTISAGFSVFHLAKPNVSFGSNSEDILYRKFTANLSAKLELQNKVISIIPIMLFQKQGPHLEMIFGSYVKFLLNENKNTALYAGAQYRLAAYEKSNIASDAFILGVRAEFASFDVGFSYDITVSNLRKATVFMGGPELYVIYTLRTSKGKRDVLKCPKF